jgi:hypothetical protein
MLFVDNAVANDRQKKISQEVNMNDECVVKLANKIRELSIALDFACAMVVMLFEVYDAKKISSQQARTDCVENARHAMGATDELGK